MNSINLYLKKVLDDFSADLLVENLLQSSEYRKRLDEVNQFNTDNRWKKKGISLNPIKWGIFNYFHGSGYDFQKDKLFKFRYKLDSR